MIKNNTSFIEIRLMCQREVIYVTYHGHYRCRRNNHPLIKHIVVVMKKKNEISLRKSLLVWFCQLFSDLLF